MLGGTWKLGPVWPFELELRRRVLNLRFGRWGGLCLSLKPELAQDGDEMLRTAPSHGKLSSSPITPCNSLMI